MHLWIYCVGMTKPRLLALLVGCAILIALILFLFRKPKPIPTQFGWQAHVVTLAGNGSPAVRDVDQPTQAAFSDPFGIAVSTDGTIYVADAAESNRIRKIAPDGNVTTLPISELSSPIGLASTHDNFLYVTELDGSRVLQIAPDGTTRVIAGGGSGFADGADEARFNQPAGVTEISNPDVIT